MPSRGVATATFRWPYACSLLCKLRGNLFLNPVLEVAALDGVVEGNY